MPAKPSGLADVKKGFCFDKEHDDLFALGWPHLRRLHDDVEVDVPRVASMHLKSTEFDLAIDWPRPVAAALIHAWGVGALFDFAPGERLFRQKAMAAMKTTHDPRPEEIRDYLAQRLRRSPLWASERATRSFVLMLEAMSSPETVIDAILDELEIMDPDSLIAWATQPAWVSFQLGYLLLRVDAAKVKKAKARMAAVLQVGAAWAEASEIPDDTPNHVRSLRLVLGGAEAADKYTDRELRWYSHAVADGETIAKRVRSHPGGAMPDLRLAWLGGADLLLERTFKRWPRLGLRDRMWFQSSLAPVNHPRTVVYMADMLGRASVEDRAKAWLREHRDFAREVLEPMKRDHEKAQKAMRMLFPYG